MNRVNWKEYQRELQAIRPLVVQGLIQGGGGGGGGGGG